MTTQSIPETDKPWRIAPDKLVIIGVDTPHKEGEHPLWDARAFLPIDEQLVLSFMAVGVLVPIQVVVVDGRPIVVDGRRRTRNAREAARRLLAAGERAITVPIVTTSGERLSDEMASLISATLNELRVSDPFMVRAKRARRLLDHGLEVKQVAIAFGVEVRVLDSWMEVLAGDACLHTGVMQGTISVATASELARLPKEKQPNALAELLKEPAKPSAPRARAIAQSIQTGAPKGSPLPRHAVSRVLASEKRFDPQFIAGVKFATGRLSADEVDAIMKVADDVTTRVA